MSASAPALTLPEAQAYCRRLTRTHYENFTVASWLLPRPMWQHVYNIYAFCRGVDDLGDEGTPPDLRSGGGPGGGAGDRLGSPTQSALSGRPRLALLDWWEKELRSCYGSSPRHPVFLALQQTIQRFDIPMEPFLRLIEANRMDQRQGRFPTFADLDLYCQHSANPVGHLFLYLFGYRDAQRQRLADYTCTALQLTNFWQDIPIDLRKGRIYLPLEDLARFGYSEAELAGGIVNDSFRALMAFQVARARRLFRRGLALVELVDGRLRRDVLLFSLGGMKILERIEGQGYDVFRRRPHLTRLDKALLLLGSLRPGAAAAAWRPSALKDGADEGEV